MEPYDTWDRQERAARWLWLCWWVGYAFGWVVKGAAFAFGVYLLVSWVS